MFGYVKVYQPELKIGEFEQYRGLYCSLCRTLKKRYGFVAQMTLSYDMTFLLVLHMALGDECAGFGTGRCPYNPFKKHVCCHDSPSLEFSADAAMLLAYHKTLDTVADSRFFKRLGARLVLPVMRRNRRRAAERLPELDRRLEQAMCAQRQLEQRKCCSVDEAAEPTAMMLAALCEAVSRDKKQQRVLSRFGYCLGRWVYLMDAADDLADDLKQGNYNPLIVSSGLQKHETEKLEHVRRQTGLSLNACIAECKAAYELLAIRRFDGILRNVCEWGMMKMQTQVLSGGRHRKPSPRKGGLTDEQSV